LGEEDRKRSKSLANNKLFKWLIGAFILLFGGITLTSYKLAILCMYRYPIPTWPYDVVVPLLGFFGFLIAIYGGYKIARK
jgi:hypothetical protein